MNKEQIAAEFGFDPETTKACVDACAGIDTAHLWPGAVAEMREALKACYDELKKHDLAGPPGAASILAKMGR